jgi:serine/threonine protein kinase
MELVDGSSIAELIASHTEKKQRISERVIREILLSISHALYYIHKKKNITHRDLTPSNVPAP